MQLEGKPSGPSEESGGDSGHCSPEPEFMRVHAQLRHHGKVGQR